MTKGKYKVRSANRKVAAANMTVDQLVEALDAANREIAELTATLDRERNAAEDTVARQVRDALRDERARMKAAARDNATALREQQQLIERQRAKRDTALAAAIEDVLSHAMERATELLGYDTPLIPDEIFGKLAVLFDELGDSNNVAGRIRNIFGHKHTSQIVNLDGTIITVPARFLNRRNAKQLARDLAENRSAR